jgi:hypothetical protein
VKKPDKTTGAVCPEASPASNPKPQRAISLAELLATDFSKEPPPDPRRPVYGIWTLADGREMLFDRDYRPLYSRRRGEVAEIADPQRPAGIIKERFFWADRDSIHSLCPATQRKLRAVLQAWGIER